ncbi:uncharacterized protein CTRU02_213188 [Colletotrichum truncatum]|uniref:Uncharacterized protein n=1 Tax=Colletotrichum truncatum TaxID=5467 RepID=A0ACC3YK08_COLTU
MFPSFDHHLHLPPRVGLNPQNTMLQPLRFVRLLSIKARTQIPQTLSYVEGATILLRGGGDRGLICLQTVVFYGIDRSMPGVWCFLYAGGDTVLSGLSSLLSRDVANFVGGDRRPITYRWLWC